MKHFYSIVVIGGGHAGIEATLVAARMGVDTLMVTMMPHKIGEMSCNPSIGGVGKGQLVKEIDAMGGEMGKAADETALQFKRLNTRKGSAVQSTRCQSDKKKYSERMQKTIFLEKNVSVFAGEVKELLVDGKKITGVRIKIGDVIEEIHCHSVIITSGTFMNGIIHMGFQTLEGGRIEENPSIGLSKCLSSYDFRIQRLKTGTPPRLIRDSIDFSQMEQQNGDFPPKKFSFSETKINLPQLPCYLAYSNRETHQVIRNNLEKSPLYSGKIKGIGPRYCPSIEDKVVKFPDKERHPIFFEPESLDSDWVYPNGISTSLPPDVQELFVRTLPGCQNVRFARYGYAVEYDCADPRDLKPNLESKLIEGLFLAGQINGTSGYEEAAAQGMMAGINAALLIKKKIPLILNRSESYIGVMIDDLIRSGVTEPYRMFTSRAEFRLSLREDNADQRLRKYGHELGVVSNDEYQNTAHKIEKLKNLKTMLKNKVVKPSPTIQEKLTSLFSSPLPYPQSMFQLLKRPELSLIDVFSLAGENVLDIEEETSETLEIETKYEGYISIQKEEIERLKKLDGITIPNGIQFDTVNGLSTEIREKLKKANPKNLLDVTKISGITPASLSALLYHLKRRESSSEFIRR